MPPLKRFKTKYVGVHYIEGRRTDGTLERIYYVTYRRNGKLVEEKAGRQFQDDMTPARAAGIRQKRIEGEQQSNREQREAAKAEKERLEAAKAAEEAKWTIAKLWDHYCETHPDNKIVRHETLKFDHYLRNSVGAKEPVELLSLDVDRIRLQLQKQGKRTTAARIMELLRRTINFGVKKALIPPIKFKIEVPRLNNTVTEDLEPNELTALIRALDAATDQTAANVMRLALFSGMRRSEILKLKWCDIDWTRGFITLVDPKGGKDQKIPFNETIRGILKDIPRKESSPFVFPGRIPGTHLTECRKGLNSIAKAAGLPKGFRPLHGLRHVYASMLASSGKVDMFTLQTLLTHKSPQMTQRYIHLRDEALRKASNVAEDILTSIQRQGENVVDMPKRNDA